MEYKTALISASRYLESQYEIILDVEDIKAVIMLRSYAKTFDDELMTYYWNEYKKSYRSHMQNQDKSLYQVAKPINDESTENIENNTGFSNISTETKAWIENMHIISESRRFIKLPTVT